MYAGELRQPDRRDLDDAVFELLGVSDSGERDLLIAELYRETATYFREGRVVEIRGNGESSQVGQQAFQRS